MLLSLWEHAKATAMLEHDKRSAHTHKNILSLSLSLCLFIWRLEVKLRQLGIPNQIKMSNSKSNDEIGCWLNNDSDWLQKPTATTRWICIKVLFWLNKNVDPFSITLAHLPLKMIRIDPFFKIKIGLFSIKIGLF